MKSFKQSTRKKKNCMIKLSNCKHRIGANNANKEHWVFQNRKKQNNYNNFLG